MKKTARGFTLIELLVVMAIIGLLSTVVLASLTTARKKGRDTKRISDVKQLQIALELYYPTAINTANLVTPGYIATVSTDPSTNAGYSYAALGSGTSCSSYHLGALLENTTHTVFSSDVDAPASDAICTGSAANFGGTDPVFDVKP
jgi:prepilin-type N-terminal cleavage/methylation domain-containing protein